MRCDYWHITLRVVLLAVALGILLASGFHIYEVLDTVQRQNELIAQAAARPPLGPHQHSAKLARMSALVEGQAALLEQHIQNLQLILALAGLFVVMLGYIVVDYIRQRLGQVVERVSDGKAKVLRKELTTKIKDSADRLSKSDGVLVRLLEFQKSGIPEHRTRALETAAAIRLGEFIGLWRELLRNPDMDLEHREIALQALKNFRGHLADTEAANALAEASTTISSEFPKHLERRELLIKCLRVLAHIGKPTAAVRSALKLISEHPDPNISAAVEEARATLFD